MSTFAASQANLNAIHDIAVVSEVDGDSILMTFHQWICSNLDRRKQLTQRAQEAHRQKGQYGVFVVSGYDLERGGVNTDLEDLFAKLEYWTLEGECKTKPLPHDYNNGVDRSEEGKDETP
ncbi:MAG: hypothetical protein SGARI_002471 [Bacillariaceae sp.]